MVQVNPIYLIFNPVHFLVDSSDYISIIIAFFRLNPLYTTNMFCPISYN